MNNDLLAVLDYLERDRGLDREVITRVIEESLESAAHKAMGPNDLKVKLDPKTGDISATAKVLVVDKVTDREKEVSLKEAQKQKDDAKIGDEIDWEVPTEELGRIVAQTTRQGIFQRLRQVEKDLLREDYKDRVGEILYGSVSRFDKGDVFIDFSGAEGILRHNQRIPSEDYQVGDHVSCVLAEVNLDQPGPVLIVSRSHDLLVQRLFEREVAEISEGIVTIKAVAREPGFRSKIAVDSKDPRVDPVGACVGIRGSRVKAIVRELNGEKVDIIRYDNDIRTYIANALKPAEIKSISINEDDRQVKIVVNPDQLSLAIGKRGQNARLTARLTGWKVDIDKEVTAEISLADKMKQAAESLASQLKIENDIAQTLVDNGFLSVDGIQEAEDSDLLEIDGINEDTVKKIKEAASQ